MEFKHTPVLLKEVLEGLNINPSGIYIDCTLGGAGHSSEIIKKLNKNGILIGFDKDIEAIKASSEKLSRIAKVVVFENFLDVPLDFSSLKDNKLPLVVIVKSDFKKSPELLEKLNIKLDGILIDLGVSSYQIDTQERGFSFRNDAILDMRMDQSQKLTAKEIVNLYSEEELASIFFKYGEEEFSRKIAKKICEIRKEKEITSTKELNNIVEGCLPKKILYSRGGASKKVFQALRIVVNSELEGLDTLINSLSRYLKIGGRYCVISFHSLEDRTVKNVFKNLSTACICPPSFPKCVCGHKAEIKLISKKPITASTKELEENSRSSCAKLRISEKVS